eukprot:11897-Heterococcus_DN1.PRE.1
MCAWPCLGGALWQFSGKLILNDGVFINNSAGESGGAIYAEILPYFVASNVNFTSNAAPTAGAYMVKNVPVSNFTGGVFSNNKAGLEGGCITTTEQSAVRVVGTVFNGNRAQYGGAIAKYGNLTLQDVSAIANTAAASGGVLRCSTSSNTIISTSSFMNNSASAGAAVSTQNELTVLHSKFTANTAVLKAAAILGDVLSKNITVHNCTFDSNAVTAGRGGSISVASNSSIDQSTFTGNSATAGGAIMVEAGGTTTITSSNFTANRATSSGAAVLAIGYTNDPVLSNNRFDNNTAGCCIAQGFGSSTRNTQSSCQDVDTSEDRGDSCCYSGQYTDYQQCSQCTDNINCTGLGSAVSSFKLLPGNWRALNASTETYTTRVISECYNTKACIGGTATDTTGLATTVAATKLSKHLVIPAVMATVLLVILDHVNCAVCATNYSPGLGHSCTACTSRNKAGAIIAAVVLLLLAATAVWFATCELRGLGSTTSSAKKRSTTQGPLQKLASLPWETATDYANTDSDSAVPDVHICASAA